MNEARGVDPGRWAERTAACEVSPHPAEGSSWIAFFHRRNTLPLVLFVLLVIVYNLNPRFMAGSDVYCTRFMPINLALHGTYYLDPSKPYHLGTVVHDSRSPSNGRMISVYPTYTPTLLLPIYVPIYRWLAIPPEHYLTFYLDKWISTIIVAAAAMFTFSLLRRLHGGRNGMALLVTVGIATGTSLWTVASQGSWAHGPSAFYMIFACWSLERAIRYQYMRRGWIWAALAGWAMASAFVTRLSNVFFVLPFFVLSLWELADSRRGQVSLLLGLFPVAAWFTIHNFAYFGNPLVTGYSYNVTLLRVPHMLSLWNFPRGFLGLLFSPSLGMFTMGPVTLFVLPGMVAVWMGKSWRTSGLMISPPAGEVSTAPYLRRLLRLATLFIVIHTLFYSCFRQWWSFWYCYRYLTDIQPFIALSIGWFFRPWAPRLSLRWPLFIPAFMFSFMVQFYGAFFWGFCSYYGQTTVEVDVTEELARGEITPGRLLTGSFDRPSCHFSLDPRKHIILSEMSSFRWDWSTLDGFSRPFASWERTYEDLFVKRLVSFEPYPPIILYQGLSLEERTR